MVNEKTKNVKNSPPYLKNKPSTVNPDDWTFEGSMAQQYKHIGNAVPVNLGTEVGYSIVKFLNQYYNLSKSK